MATNTKGIYYRTNTDAAITEEARSLALANSVPVGPNYIINGAMDIWQRGDSHSSLGSAPYTADRWQFTYGSGSAGTVSRSTDVPADAGVRYSLSMAMTSSQDPRMIQKVESINAAPLANKVATLSFWAKSTVGSFVLSIFGQVASATDNWSSVTNVMYQDITLTSSWQRFSVTATMPSTIVNGIQIVFLRGSTAGSASTTLITGVQLEEGSYATPFRRNANSIQGELAACQRYYERSYNIGVALGTNTNDGNVSFRTTNTTSASMTIAQSWYFKVSKRSTPTIRLYGTYTGTVDRINVGTTDFAGTVYGASQNGASAFVGGTIPANSDTTWQWTADSEL